MQIQLDYIVISNSNPSLARPSFFDSKATLGLILQED